MWSVRWRQLGRHKSGAVEELHKVIFAALSLEADLMLKVDSSSTVVVIVNVALLRRCAVDLITSCLAVMSW